MFDYLEVWIYVSKASTTDIETKLG